MMKKAKLFIVPALCLILVSCGNGSGSAQQEDEMIHEKHMRDEEMPHDEHMMEEDTFHEERMHGDTLMDNGM